MSQDVLIKACARNSYWYCNWRRSHVRAIRQRNQWRRRRIGWSWREKASWKSNLNYGGASNRARLQHFASICWYTTRTCTITCSKDFLHGRLHKVLQMHYPQSSCKASKSGAFSSRHYSSKDICLWKVCVLKANAAQNSHTVAQMEQHIILPTQEPRLVRLWQVVETSATTQDFIFERVKSTHLHADDKDAWCPWVILKFAWIYIRKAWRLGKSWGEAENGR